MDPFAASVTQAADPGGEPGAPQPPPRPIEQTAVSGLGHLTSGMMQPSGASRSTNAVVRTYSNFNHLYGVLAVAGFLVAWLAVRVFRQRRSRSKQQDADDSACSEVVAQERDKLRSAAKLPVRPRRRSRSPGLRIPESIPECDENSEQDLTPMDLIRIRDQARSGVNRTGGDRATRVSIYEDAADRYKEYPPSRPVRTVRGRPVHRR